VGYFFLLFSMGFDSSTKFVDSQGDIVLRSTSYLFVLLKLQPVDSACHIYADLWVNIWLPGNDICRKRRHMHY
jgi:hypothetical protein